MYEILIKAQARRRWAWYEESIPVAFNLKKELGHWAKFVAPIKFIYLSYEGLVVGISILGFQIQKQGLCFGLFSFAQDKEQQKSG